jgi:adenylylsulfate kinase-like enzyme
MKKIKKNKSKGILFWITGLSGSGKTSIGKKIKKKIIEIYGPTLVISGDNIRKMFKFNKYTYKERYALQKKYFDFAKFVTNQNINLIFAAGLGVSDDLRRSYKKNIDNYVEIYIKTDLKKIINSKKKRIYMQKSSPIVGIDIKPSFPKNPNIILRNDFKKNIQQLSEELIKKIKRILK